MRVSSRFAPANGRLKENQNSASATTSVSLRSEVAALVDQPGDRLGERERGRGARDQRRKIWRIPSPLQSPQAVEVAAGGEARELREQHGRDRHAEHPLRQHVDAEGGVDRARRALGDERAEHRVDQQVEVDEPEADRHRQHQLEHLLDPRVAPVERDAQGEADPPQDRQRHRELDDRAGEDADRVGVDLLAARRRGRAARRARR